jgi:putative membrane protein
MVAVLPHVTAALNALACLLLLTGFALIRLGRRAAHRAVMTAAVVTSALFVVSYLLHHFTAPLFAFPGRGLIRPVYFAMLASHVVLAAVAAPMVIVTFRRARRGAFELHRGLARWTLPVWLYVSVTGIAVYLLLYHVYGPGA